MIKGVHPGASGSCTIRKSKFFISGKDNKNAMVIAAESEAAVIDAWSESTGRKKSEAQARKLGTRAETITRGIKPSAQAAVRETKGEKEEK